MSDSAYHNEALRKSRILERQREAMGRLSSTQQQMENSQFKTYQQQSGNGMYYRPFDIKRRVEYGIKHRNVDNTAVDQIKPLMSSHSVLYPNLGPSGSRIRIGGRWPTTTPAYGGHSQSSSLESSNESFKNCSRTPSYYKVSAPDRSIQKMSYHQIRQGFEEDWWKQHKRLRNNGLYLGSIEHFRDTFPTEDDIVEQRVEMVTPRYEQEEGGAQYSHAARIPEHWMP